MRKGLLALALLATAAPAAAQEDLSKVEIKVERLAPGVAVLFGSGGNIGLSYGVDGNIIIDDQFAPLTDKILAAIKTVDPDPVKFVINTHWHFDHVGGNENLGKAGAVIVAHDNVRARMSTEQVLQAFNQKFPPSPKEALPVVTFSEGVSLHLNGDTLHVVHIANAHTDGDALIHWQKANVLHMGDTFMNKVSFPFIDIGSGGSIHGFVTAAEHGLALANENTKIIPGHGPVATRADLVRHRDMLVEIRDKVAADIAAKRSLDQIKAANHTARWGMPDGFVKPEQFVEAVYNSLNQPKAAEAHGHDH